MWAWFQHLAAQQTTAPELATFLLLVTVASVLASAVCYAAIMTVAWGMTLRAKHSWFDVVFPSTKRLKAHAGEYVLAGLTSVILTMTLAQKDALVDRVLDIPASAFIDSSVVARIFPLGRLPTGADLKGPSLKAEVARLESTSLRGLVHGPLEAGRSEGVRAVFVAAAKQVLDDAPAIGPRITAVLEVLCYLMMAVYVLWLSTRRVKTLSKAVGEVPDLQGEVAGRLVVLGVCLALLLANPLGNPNAELLADSAVAAARIAPPQAPHIDSLATLGIRRQSDVLASGTMSRDDVARRRLAELSTEFDAADRRLLALDASLAKALQAIANNSPSAELGNLTLAVDSLRRRALLFVLTATGAPYVVQGQTTKFGAKGSSVGLYWVPPGTYSLLDAAGNGTPVVLQPGQSRAVLVR